MFGQYAALARVLAMLLAAAGLFCSGWYVNGMRHENVALKAKNDADAAARATEAVWTLKVYDLATRLRLSQESADNEENRVTAGLLDGSIRLQPRLTCVSQAAPAASGGNDPAPTGLTGSDAAALIAIAADGDRAIRQLDACQSYVKQILGDQN